MIYIIVWKFISSDIDVFKILKKSLKLLKYVCTLILLYKKITKYSNVLRTNNVVRVVSCTL